MHICYKIHMLNKLILLNQSKIIYKWYKDIEYLIDRIDKISFKCNQIYSDEDTNDEDTDENT